MMRSGDQVSERADPVLSQVFGKISTARIRTP